MNKKLISRAALFLSILILVLAPVARAQEKTNSGNGQSKEEEAEANTGASTEALQKATQNPVASLISVPVQNNSNFGVNPGYRTQDVLNIQL